jgi:hypothetical protein
MGDQPGPEPRRRALTASTSHPLIVELRLANRILLPGHGGAELLGHVRPPCLASRAWESVFELLNWSGKWRVEALI